MGLIPRIESVQDLCSQRDLDSYRSFRCIGLAAEAGQQEPWPKVCENLVKSLSARINGAVGKPGAPEINHTTLPAPPAKWQLFHFVNYLSKPSVERSFHSYWWMMVLELEIWPTNVNTVPCFREIEPKTGIVYITSYWINIVLIGICVQRHPCILSCAVLNALVVSVLSTLKSCVFPACRCNIHGSLGPSCSKLGGVCECKPNVIGRCCETCAPQTYGFGPDGCQRMLLFTWLVVMILILLKYCWRVDQSMAYTVVHIA